MLKTIAMVLAALAAATLIYTATRPDSFRVERSAAINARPEIVFPLISDFRQWAPWSPWEKINPQLERTYSGAQAGQGAIYEWRGNKDIGAGRMEIIESVPATRVRIKLDFLAPFEAHNTIEFTLTPQGDGTRVTQAMYGPSPFASKLMGLFFSMDKMVGDKYEEGLATLKDLAEHRQKY